MTTNATTAEDRLRDLGIRLPDAPTPFGAYVPAVQTGKLLFLSGMLATSGHTATVVGIVGKDLDVKAARLFAPRLWCCESSTRFAGRAGSHLRSEALIQLATRFLKARPWCRSLDRGPR